MFCDNFCYFNEIINNNDVDNNNMRIFSFTSSNGNDNSKNFNFQEGAFNFLNDNNSLFDLKENMYFESVINQQSELSEFSNFVNMNIILPEKKKLDIKDNKTNLNSTATRTLNPQIAKTKIKKKEKMFKTKKVNNKSTARRKIKNSSKEISPTHTKNQKDNIIMKIKRTIYKHSLVFLNKKLKNSKNSKLVKLRLFKVNKTLIVVHKKQQNLDILKKNLKDIFYNELSSKYFRIDKNHNIKTIDKIIEENDEEIKAILNTTIKDIIDIFCFKNKNNLFADFNKIDKDIEKFRVIYADEGEDKEIYINNYRNTAENFEKILKKIHPREKKFQRKKKLIF